MGREFQVNVIQKYVAFCRIKPDPASSCNSLLEKVQLAFSLQLEIKLNVNVHVCCVIRPSWGSV